MEPDKSNFGTTALMFNGCEIGTFDSSTEIAVPTEELDVIPLDWNMTFEGTFKLTGESKRRLSLFFNLNLENFRLNRILNKTKKLRVKKKLAGRINRNIYRLIQYGLVWEG